MHVKMAGLHCAYNDAERATHRDVLIVLLEDILSDAPSLIVIHQYRIGAQLHSKLDAFDFATSQGYCHANVAFAWRAYFDLAIGDGVLNCRCIICVELLAYDNPFTVYGWWDNDLIELSL